MLMAKIKKQYKKAISIAFITLASSFASAEKTLDPDMPGYLSFKPLTTNFDSEIPNKLAYLKVEYNLRLESEVSIPIAELYRPQIRDIVLYNLNKQTYSNIDKGAKRQLIADKITDEINQMFIDELGEPHVKELMWTFFVIQR